MATKTINVKEYKELKENGYRCRRMMGRLKRVGVYDSETEFEVACVEIGRLQGFEQGVDAAVELNK